MKRYLLGSLAAIALLFGLMQFETLVPQVVAQVNAVSMPAVTTLWDQRGSYIGALKGQVKIARSGAAIPVTSACGTNTIVGNDSAMSVTISAGTPATCAITFGTAWAAAPVCWYNDETTANANGGKAIATTTLVTLTLPTFTGAAASFATDTVNIFCVGRS